MNYDIFEDFVKNYKGPKLAFVVTGGGIGIHNLAQMLGASKILHAIYVPYSYEESERFIASAIDSRDGIKNGAMFGKQYVEEGAVSKHGATLLQLAGRIVWPDCRVIACTAATTTSRYRRGENQAYIAMTDPGQVLASDIKHFHLKLSKISESDYQMMGLGYAAWKRCTEDAEITRFLLRVANGQ